MIINFFLSNLGLIKILLIMSIIAIIILIILTTNYCKLFFKFVMESKIELKKVTWPSYNETLNISLMVLFFSIIMTMILWLLDGMIIYLISFFTNFRI